jgi:Tol biopolymer transport system component
VENPRFFYFSPRKSLARISHYAQVQMNPTITLAELRGRGVCLSAHEAVAIAQALIHSDQSVFTARPPYGPATPETVTIDGDGSVACRTCAATPAVSEIAILLQELLPIGTKGVPGALRYALGRALLEVEAPPFDSLEDFSRALARFEGGERRRLLRDVYQRAVATRPKIAGPVVPFTVRDRRRPTVVGSERRHQLRDLDRQLFEQRQAEAAAAAAPARVGWFVRRAPIAACFAAGLCLILAGEFLTFRQDQVQPAVPGPDSQPVAGTQQSSPNGPPSPAAPEQSTRATPGTGASRQGAIETFTAIDERQSALNSTREGLQGSVPAATVRSSVGGRRKAAAPAGPDTSRDKLDRANGAREAANTDDRERPHLAEPAIVQAIDSRRRPVFSPAFASNGTAMFFHSGQNTGSAPTALMSLDSASADLRVMTIVDDGSRNYHVQPSPDGKLIAFDSDRDGERGVYVAARDGTGVRRVSGDGYAAVPTWSPDGERLAFIRAEPENSRVWNLWLLKLDAGDMRRLTSFKYGQTWGASWFSDGQRIVYTHEDRLIVHDLATDRLRQYASPLKQRLVRTPAVSPDGTKIVFQVYRNGAWLLDLTDGSMRCVLTDPTAEEFAWAPDGRRVAFHSKRDGQWGIWMMSGM